MLLLDVLDIIHFFCILRVDALSHVLAPRPRIFNHFDCIAPVITLLSLSSRELKNLSLKPFLCQHEEFVVPFIIARVVLNIEGARGNYVGLETSIVPEIVRASGEIILEIEKSPG